MVSQQEARRCERGPYSDKLLQTLDISKPVGTRDPARLRKVRRDEDRQPRFSEYELSDAASIDDKDRGLDEGEEDGIWEIESDSGDDRELEARENPEPEVPQRSVIYTLTGE